MQFIQGNTEEVIESAKIEGANDMWIFLKSAYR